MEKNYLRTVTQGTWWNYLQYVFSIGTSFILSIVLTRYFATDVYGVYTYVYFVVNTVVLTLNFGLTTTLQTFVPPLHFGEQFEERNATFRQLLKIQMFIVLLGLVILLPFVPAWQRVTTFRLDGFGTLIFLGILLSAVNVTINFFATLFSSLQKFRLLSLVNVVSQLLSFLAALAMVFFNQQLLFILLVTLTINLSVLVRYVWLSREMIGGWSNIIRQRVNIRKMLSFSFLAYVNVLLQLVIWDRSEFFFLGKFQPSDQLAIYGISYTIALMIVGLIDPIMNVFVSILSELVGKNDWGRIKLIVEKGSKYVGIIFLPTITVLLLYGPQLIGSLYGQRFLNVAIIVPWLTLSALIARAFIPAWAVTTYKHDLRQIVKIELGVAAFNILLDVILIPRYGFVGAAWANCLTQAGAFVALGVYVRKYGLHLFRSTFIGIVVVNMAIAGLLILAKAFLLGWTFHLLFFGTGIAYMLLMVKFFLQSDDLLFMQDMQAHGPSTLRPIVRVGVKLVHRLKGSTNYV